MRGILLVALAALALAAPVALAQDGNATDEEKGRDGGDTTINVGSDEPDNVDVDVTDRDGGDGADVQESVGAGINTTTVVVLVVLAVLVIALVVAFAGRDRW